MQGIQWTRMSVWMEEGGILPATRFIWPGGVVWQKLSNGLCPVSWIPCHLFLGTWRVGLYRPSKTQDQCCWQWALQGEVPKNSSPIMDKVHAHVKDMLEVGAICPSQSPWCNAVVLVCKRDWGLCFCIDFCKLNARTKKDSFPLPQIQEAIESLVGAGYFSCLGLKAEFWQIAMDEVLKQYTTFTVGNLEFFSANACYLCCVTPQLHFKG